MRYPKDTLTKHGVVRYQRNGERFLLNGDVPEKERQEAIELYDAKITEWLQRKRDGEQAPAPNELVRYRVLKRAKGKCELCGIPSSLRPIDIDHVEPQSRADKNGNVVLDGKRVNVHSEDNLQALCIKCNRAKRDQDNTDYRRTSKLVRDRILYIIRQNGREPIVRRLSGKAIVKALNEKLVEEHEEYIEAGSVEELADMIEVIISLAKKKDTSQEELLQLVEEKRTERGVFEQGFFYVGDK
jgi:predicted house-cleaning noncanonical NTP pyrophosphatase (MazG superfamily)